MIRTIKRGAGVAGALAVMLLVGCGGDHNPRTTTTTHVTQNPDGSTTTTTTEDRKR